jgi:hypothetical protein
MENLGQKINEYINLNIPTFPVVGKIPVVSWKPFQTRFPTQEEITEWELNKNITGIAGTSGEFSGLIVIDCDIKNPKKSCDKEIIKRLRDEGHPEVQTGSGGSQFFVQWQPLINTKDGVLTGVDIKSNGGCFTLPPSIAQYGQDELEYFHFNGNEYKWIKEFKRDELKPFPQWLLDMITESPEYKVKTEWEGVLNGVSDGKRNGSAASVAGKILIGLKTEEWESVGWALFEGWNLKNVPPLSTQELRTTFKSIARTELARRNGLPTPTPAPERKIVSVNELLKMTPNPEPFLLQGIIVKGSINALTSDSGRGKSLLALKMVEAIATGEKFLGEFVTQKSKTLVIDLEMSKDDIIERTQSIIHHEMDGLDFYHSQTFNICDDQDFEWLKNTISINEYKLLVLDTYSMAHNKNENDNTEVNIVNHRLLRLINECNITILFLHHHRKLSKGEQMSQSSSRGATDIIGKTASHLLLDTKDIMVASGTDTDRTLLKGIRIVVEQMKRRKATGFDMFAVKVWYDPATKLTTFLFDGFDEKAENATDKTKTMLLAKMEVGEEYTRKDLQNMVGKSSNLSSALKVLIEQDKILGFRSPTDDDFGNNGKHIPSNAKIYFLSSEELKEPVQPVQKLV